MPLRFFSSFSSLIPRPPTSTLFPYTTLFRSSRINARASGCDLEPCNFSTSRRNLERFFEDHRLYRRRSEEHTSELQSPCNLVCRLLLEKKNIKTKQTIKIYQHPDHESKIHTS